MSFRFPKHSVGQRRPAQLRGRLVEVLPEALQLRRRAAQRGSAEALGEALEKSGLARAVHALEAGGTAFGGIPENGF